MRTVMILSRTAKMFLPCTLTHFYMSVPYVERGVNVETTTETQRRTCGQILTGR
jgi:hypothetical protein